MSNLQVAVAQFAENIRKMVVDEILGSFGGASAHAAPKRLGRPLGSKNGVSRATKAEASIPVSEWNDLPSVKKPRKKPPVQYCPVPRCHNVAAPAFGMVCGKHKDLPKGEIRKYREARAEKRALEAGKVKKTAKKTKAKKTK